MPHVDTKRPGPPNSLVPKIDGPVLASLLHRRAGLITAIAGLAFVVARVHAVDPGNWRKLALIAIGVGLGLILFTTDFGFSAAFRRAAIHGDFSRFRAHALMLGLASLLMVPMIALGSVLGTPVTGFATPVGISFALGALLFGMGMQLAGGCASGTLFLLGGGNLKFLVALAFFVAGSAVGAAHIAFWHALPALPPLSIAGTKAWPLALAVELAALACVWRWAPSTTRLPPALIAGGVGLALLNSATLVVAGRPWSETYGFALWGSKLAVDIGFQPDTWEFWGDGAALQASIFADITSIMDFSIILGAMLAAGLTGSFHLRSGGGWRSWLSAAIGGLVMGYGARLAEGCNIGAYFSAIASGSLSGYVWAIVAILGSYLGARLRTVLEQRG